MRLLFMSAYLSDYHPGILNTNFVLNPRSCSKLKCCQFLYRTSNLDILSDSFISKNILCTKNVRYGEIFKASKKPC